MTTLRKTVNKKDTRNSLPSEEKENNQPSSWFQELLKVHPFMSKLIKEHPSDPQRVICIICSDNNKLNNEGTKEVFSCQKSWLKKHLSSPSHNSYIKNPDEKDWMVEIISISELSSL